HPSIADAFALLLARLLRGAVDPLRCEPRLAARRQSLICAGEHRYPRFQRPDAAAGNRDDVVHSARQLNHFVVAGSPGADDAVDIDDMAAMHPGGFVVVPT